MRAYHTLPGLSSLFFPHPLSPRWDPFLLGFSCRVLGTKKYECESPRPQLTQAAIMVVSRPRRTSRTDTRRHQGTGATHRLTQYDSTLTPYLTITYKVCPRLADYRTLVYAAADFLSDKRGHQGREGTRTDTNTAASPLQSTGYATGSPDHRGLPHSFGSSGDL